MTRKEITNLNIFMFYWMRKYFFVKSAEVNYMPSASLVVIDQRFKGAFIIRARNENFKSHRENMGIQNFTPDDVTTEI